VFSASEQIAEPGEAGEPSGGDDRFDSHPSGTGSKSAALMQEDSFSMFAVTEANVLTRPNRPVSKDSDIWRTRRTVTKDSDM